MASSLRLVFFGTPDFAVPALAALVAAGEAPLLVVSQPDRPAGRGQALRSSAVARFARRASLPLAQPEKVRDPAFLAELGELAPDLALVVAFGQIFPRALLELPRLGCVNLHASLLPRWRGAAPVQAAIAAGDEETGVCTQQMATGLDTGPVLLERRTPIGGDETAGELTARLAVLGAELLVETVRGLIAGTLVARPQDEALATLAPKLHRGQARVEWERTAVQISRQLRAATPWPGMVAELGEQPVHLVGARVLPPLAAPQPTGTVVGWAGEALAVACGEGSCLGLLRLQRPGRRSLLARDFANGERLRVGARFR